MEVRPGYKQTEVGVIPHGWNIATLSSVCDIVAGQDLVKVHFSRSFDHRHPFPIYSNALTEKGLYGYSSAYQFEADKVTVTARGDIGHARYRNSRFCAIGRLLVLSAKAECDLRFVTEFINNFVDFAVESTGVPQLTAPQISNYRVALPPTKAEQQAIAEALSDADVLIESLEQLIAKKRHLKQGAMQELLQPKNGWKETTPLDLANGKKELFDDGDWIEAEHITSDGVRFVQTGNIGVGQFIEKEAKKYIFESSFRSLHCKEIREGDLLICRLADPAGRACVLPDIGETKIVTSVDVTIFRPPASAANRVFLENLFSTNQWFREVGDRSGGTTHKRISRGALGRIRIRLPPVGEQCAIASILRDMDAEIAALESELSKARSIKQGMMQELLTGRIRLL
jgi:type I restriction enzyme S subunit